MVFDISLDHLKEDEVELILKVLERDAKIQQQEEERRRRLQESVRGERIPEKRLSVKIRTGEWMSEITAPSRATKRRGTEVVRASIRRKKPNKQADEVDSVVESGAEKVNGVVQNGGVLPAQLDLTTTETAAVEEVKDSQEKSPIRKTSIRRRKTSPTSDKQVKFDTEKTKKFVYDQTSIDSTDGIPAIVVEKSQIIPTIVVQTEETAIAEEKVVDVAQPVEVTVITDDASTTAAKEEPYDNSVFAKNSTFESYHNIVGREMYKDEVAKHREKADEEDKDKKSGAPKIVKKMKVVKRKGSSRRKAGKLADDSARDSLFNAPAEEKAKEEEKKVVEEAVEAVIAVATEQTPEPEILVTASDDPYKKELYYQETPVVITKGPFDDVYPESNVQEEEKREEDPSLISSIMGEVAKEYEKLVKEEEPKMDEEAEVKAEIKDTSEAVQEDYAYSPKPDMDLGLGDVLDTITEKYDSMATEVKEALTDFANDISPFEVKNETPQAVAAPEVEIKQPEMVVEPAYVAPEVEQKQPEVLPEPEEISATPVIEEEKIADSTEDSKPAEAFGELITQITESAEVPVPIVNDLVESVLEAAQTTPKESEEEEKQDDDEHKTDKPKKKVVKRVIKKKKVEKPDGEQGSPKTEPGKENDEESHKNISQLTRKKTVRKKVIRKAPPPSE